MCKWGIHSRRGQKLGQKMISPNRNLENLIKTKGKLNVI